MAALLLAVGAGLLLVLELSNGPNADAAVGDAYVAQLRGTALWIQEKESASYEVAGK